MKDFTLCVMSRKGYAVLLELFGKDYAGLIDKVVISRDEAMVNDYYNEMYTVCKNAGVNVYDRNDSFIINSPFVITISWRWMLPLSNASRLIVFHDSLLPKYRGFAPLVNMLINHEPYIGVTALYASAEYDKGDIISQRKVAVHYPIKITDAIDLVTPLYSDLICDIFDKININEPLIAISQKENESSYSLWRDEDDYFIDWNQSSDTILQFIYSVGFPFKGASTKAGGVLYRIQDAEICPDVTIENRHPGKVIFFDGGLPVIVCGKGLLKLTSVTDEEGRSVLPFRKFRIRFE